MISDFYACFIIINNDYVERTNIGNFIEKITIVF